MSDALRKKETEELRAYQKKSLIIRGVTALGTLALTAVIGYLRGKASAK
jgi:hypothetical protein